MKPIFRKLLPACFALLLIASYSKHAVAQNSEAIQDEISYTNDIRPIVNNFCTTCHAGETPEGDFVLTSYEDVREHVEEGELLDRINDADAPMPQNGLMPKYMRRMFQLWADGGYLNKGKPSSGKDRAIMQKFNPIDVVPVDINEQGFELLEYMQGHWVGSMNLMGQEFEWMAFDYRPIAPAHIHGIFEGGTIGNLFTSFFVTEFKGKRTIMARNGGMLNGIYRTSYFVLDEVKYGTDWGSYRLVDAYGLTEPRKHMAFKGERMHATLAQDAAEAVGFPKNVIDFEFPKKLPKPTWADDYPLTSASYLSEEKGKTLIELGKLANDPRRIDQMPFLSKLSLKIDRPESINGKKLIVLLSKEALVDKTGKFITTGGYIREDLLNTILTFPELGPKQKEFTFTYLHPGDYYLTVVADMNEDGFPSPGDITHPQIKIKVEPNSETEVSVDQMTAKN